MFRSWMPDLARNLTNYGNNSSPQPPRDADTTEIVNIVLSRIQEHITDKLGQTPIVTPVQAGEIVREIKLEKSLIESKEKYHSLVNLLNAQNQSLKLILSQIVQLLTGIGERLGSEQVLIPVKEFEVGFQNLNAGKVEKQLKYLLKLIESALGEYSAAEVNARETSWKQEMHIIKNYSKSVEIELKKQREKCEELESKLRQAASVNSQLNQKNDILDKLGSQAALNNYTEQLTQFKQKQKEYLQKISKLEKDRSRLEKAKKDTENQLTKSVTAIQVLKRNQEQLIEQNRKQLMKKQLNYKQSISKLCQSKLNSEEKAVALAQELQACQTIISQIKSTKDISPKKERNSQQLSECLDQIDKLKQQNKRIHQQISLMVSKQVMKTLFVSFEDESREWAVRKDIKNQIYVLLGIPVKKEEHVAEKGWFAGFF